jgi:hypothetical protein
MHAKQAIVIRFREKSKGNRNTDKQKHYLQNQKQEGTLT